MTVFERIQRTIQAWRSEPSARSAAISKRAPYMFPLFLNGQPHWQMGDLQAYIHEGYNLNSVIYSAISYKARALGKARLRAYTGDVDNPEPLPFNHPLAQLLARPNPYQSWVEFQQQRETFLNVAGNCYTWHDRPARGKLATALYNLRPDRVWIVPDTNGIKGYLYIPEGQPQERTPLLPSDVEHVKLPNPGDPLEGLGYGLSPMMPLAQSGDVDNAITAFLKMFIERGAMMSGLIKTKVPLDNDGVNRIKQRWQEQYGGVTKWGDIGVLDVESDYQRLGLTFEEMEFDGLDARNESRMLGPFGVPPILIFTRYGLERSTFSNAEEARKALWEDTLTPELDLFYADDAYYLGGGEDAAFVLYDTSSIPALQKNLTVAVDAAFKLWQMGTPANQAVAAVGLKLSDIPGGDIGYLPFGVTPVGVAPPESGDSADEAPAAPTDEREGANKTLPKAARPTSSKAQRWGEDEKARLWKQADDIAVAHEDAFRETAGRQFKLDKREVLALVSDIKRKSLRLKAAIQWDSLIPDVEQVFAEAGDRWNEAFAPQIAGVVTDAAEHWRVEAGLAFNVANLQAQEWFIDYAAQFSTPITDTSEREISALLQQGAREGWSTGEMTKALSQLFQQWIDGDVDAAEFAAERLPPWRSELIARTETTRAYGAGSAQIYAENGVGREWLAALDDRTRESHALASGQVVGIDEPFIVGGYEMMYPGDMSLGAPLEEAAACRCTILPDV